MKKSETWHQILTIIAAAQALRPGVSEGFVHIAMIRLMLARILP